MSVKSDIVFDDDDSSSSDNDLETLQTFHKKYASETNIHNRKYSSRDADDEVSESTSDIDEDPSDQTASYSSESDEHLPKQNSSMPKPRENIKVETLTSQQSSLDKANKDNIELDECNKSLKGKHPKQLRNVENDDCDSAKNFIIEMGMKKKSAKYHSIKGSESKEDKERIAIRDELSKMSIEEMLALKETLGLKVYNRSIGLDSSKQSKHKEFKKRKADDMKRENKNRPRQMSSKKTVKRFRDVVGLTTEKKVERRDPRFDNMCGEFNEKIHRDAYKFVDDIKAKEIKVLREELENENDPEKVKKIKYLIQRMENQNREKKKLESEKSALREQKKQNRQLIKDGNVHEFVSKKEEKSRHLIKKYEELKDSNKLEHYMKKKNKKNLAKERNRLKAVVS